MKLSATASVVIIGLCALIFSVVVLDGPLKRSLVAENSSKIKAGVLLKQLDGFPVCPGSKKISEPYTADKEVLTSASARFHTDGAAQEIFDCYDSFAYTEKMLPVGLNSGRERRFCKEGVSLSIEVNEIGSGVDYTIRLVWTNQVRSRSYCPQ